MTAQLFQRARSQFQRGGLNQAAALCREILQIDAGHFNALHLMGLVELRRGDLSQAIQRLQQSIAIAPKQPAVYLNLSHAFLRAGKPQAALAACDAALAQRPDYTEALTNRGNALLELKRPVQALASYDRALSANPESSDLFNNRANALRDLHRSQEALASYQRAVQICPTLAAAYIGQVEMLWALKRPQEALACCEQLQKLVPDDADGLQLLAQVLLDLRRPEAALIELDRALQQQPRSSAILVAQGNALFQLGRVEEALERYERALEDSPSDGEIYFNRGHALFKLGHFEAAAVSYDAALVRQPTLVKAHYHRGNALRRLGRSQDSLRCYASALSLDPTYSEAMSGMANALRDLDRPAESLVYYADAVERDPTNIEALSNRGALLLSQKRPEEAIECFERLLQMDADHADYNYTLGRLMHARLLCCDWSQYESQLTAIVAGVEADERVTLPSLLTVIDDSAHRQLRCARGYAADNCSIDATAIGPYGHTKIRLAYISADFREHPVSQLMVELFETHDRGRFETIGVSLRPSDGSALARRVEAAFDQFVPVTGQTDESIAARLRQLEVDIAVDLTGYTEGSSGIFARRAAPVQVNFLGYPGTTAAAYMDYLIADRVVIPAAEQCCYTEHIVRLPHCFMPTESHPATAFRPPRRTEYNLPDDAFVFCCFNNHHKILPQVFDAWMRLLRAMDGSVLWLAEGSGLIMRNLATEAEKRGVRPERLVYAPRLREYADHLARYRLADLFLDTLPYNAHKTAIDALAVGLPLLTCRGGSFASKVAASLLSALGMPELITESLQQYEALALRLAQSPEMLASVRSKLWRHRDSHPLFDTTRYRRHLESAYVTLWDRAERAEQPVHLVISPTN